MTFKFLKANFHGDSNIGFYGFATDEYCLLGLEPKPSLFEKVKETIATKIKIAMIASTQMIGLFAAGNKNGIILTKIVEKEELNNLKSLLDVNIEVIKSRHTAHGNLITCNDNGCLISELLARHKEKIRDVLGCEVETGTVAGYDIVGSTAVATNVGCLCHRDATEEEIKKLEEVLKVKVDVGSIGYGSPYIKSGIIVNSKGIIVSDKSTGPELGRCDEVFNKEGGLDG